MGPAENLSYHPNYSWDQVEDLYSKYLVPITHQMYSRNPWLAGRPNWGNADEIIREAAFRVTVCYMTKHTRHSGQDLLFHRIDHVSLPDSIAVLLGQVGPYGQI